MKRGRPRKDGLGDLLPGRKFVRECIRNLYKKPRKVRGPQRNVVRECRMVELYREGQTLTQIGESYGLTRERIRQLLSRHGIDADDGGAHARFIGRVLDRGAERRARLESRCQATFGCSLDAFYEITGATDYAGISKMLASHPIVKAYHNQKRTAKSRRIEWKFTLPEWWAMWRDSGHWEERGRGDGYCMARWADDGPYSPDNVYITTNSENIKHSYIVKPATMRAEKARRTREAASAQNF